MKWQLIPQQEHVGEGVYEEVLVKHLRGGKSRQMEDGVMVEKSFRFPNLMFKAMIDTANPAEFMLPREIVFSQMWVSRKDGTKWTGGTGITRDPETKEPTRVRLKPDTRFYYKREKVTVKTVCMRYFKEERTGKRCVSKVTQRIGVDEWTNGAQQDDNGDWWVKYEIDNTQFEVNDKDGCESWGLCLAHIAKTFGIELMEEFAAALFARIQEAKAA